MAVDLQSYTSPQMELTKKLVRAVRAGDLSLLAETLHKDFHHVINPQSLGKPPVNRDEWLATMAEAFNASFQLETTYHSLTEAPGKVVIHVSVSVKGLFGKDGTDESMWILGFASDEDGSLKIKEITQFAYTSNYINMPFGAVKASK